MEDNVVKVVQHYLKNLNIKVSPNTIKKTLLAHPNYPSLLSIADGLKEWKIETQALLIEKSNLKYNDFKVPFFAHLRDKTETFVLVHSISENEVIYSDENNSKGNFSIEIFLRRWTGVILNPTPNVTSGDKRFLFHEIDRYFSKLTLPACLMLIMLLAYFILTNNLYKATIIPILLLKMIGSLIGVMIISQTYFGNNGIGKEFCNLIKKNNCNVILKSEAGKVFEWLSWGEVGFYYFLGSFIALMFDPEVSQILAILNFVAIPFTIYSFTYQYRVKSWCILCCSVQIVLLAEFYYFLQTFEFDLLQLNIFGIATLITSFGLTISIWLMIKTLYIRTAKLAATTSALRKLKFNHGIFDYLMLHQPYFEVGEEVGAITIGNSNATNEITFVSSPFCPPCSHAHHILDDMIKYNDNVMVKLIFVSDDRDDDERTQMVRHLNALYHTEGADAVHEAVNSWFATKAKSYAKWATKYPIEPSLLYSPITLNHNKWCDDANIQYTPTFLINGKVLPDLFSINDLKYLIN